MTQKDVAFKTGIRLSATRSHESGQWPNRNNQDRYLNFYKCDKNWFLTGDGVPYDIEVDVHDQVGVGDSLQIDMRGPDGRIRPEDSGAVDAHGRPVDNLSVGSPRHLYGATESMNTGLGQAVEMLSHVLGSGDQVMIRAILSNLEAFSRAVNRDSRQSDRIKALEKKCEDFEELLKNQSGRIAFLEEKIKAGSHLSLDEELTESTAT